MRTPAACLLLIALLNQPALASKYDQPALLTAKEHVPTILLSGPNHQLNPDVENNSFQNTYILETDFGEFQATGIAELQQKVKEADSLAYLKNLSKTGVFLEELKDTGVDSVATITKAFTSPVKTVSGIPDGINKLFKGTVEGTKRGFGLTKRFLKDKPDELDAADFKEMNALVGESERKWAAELGTDPYTTNLVLRKAISSMSVVQFIGGLPVDLALPMGAGIALGVLDADSQVYSQSASQLAIINQTCLEQAEVSSEVIGAFFAAPYLTPTTQTLFCESLTALDGVENANQLTTALVDSESFEESRYVLSTIDLLVWHHQNNAPLTRIIADSGLPYAVGENTDIIVMLPADYLLWTDLTADRFASLNQVANSEAVRDKTVWILGNASPLAITELGLSQWTVNTRANNNSLAEIYSRGIVVTGQ